MTKQSLRNRFKLPESKMATVSQIITATDLRLMNLSVGLLINFGVATLKEGLHRVVNNLQPSASPRLRVNL